MPVDGGSAVLVAAIRELDAAGVTVHDVGLRRPTLDDVFLSLTGHAAEEPAEGSDDQPADRPGIPPARASSDDENKEVASR